MNEIATTGNLIADLNHSLEYWHKILKERYPSLSEWKKPEKTITQLRGTTAGSAQSSVNKVNFHYGIYKDNPKHFLNSTVPHELCHLACRIMYGTKPSSHGPEWTSIMRSIGCVPTPCHSYDVGKFKSTLTYRYVCKNTHLVDVDLKIHLQLQKERNMIARCPKCKNPLSFQGKA